MSGLIIALVTGVATPMDIGVGGVFYMETDSPQTKFYGAEAEFLAHLMMDRLYLRTGILYFIKGEGDYTSIGLGSGVGGFGGGSVDALYYFTKQNPKKYKMSPYVLGGFYFSKVSDFTNYGLKAGAGISFPFGKRSPMRFFGEAGALIDGFSAPDPVGSDNAITAFARGGVRFNIIN
ncbi:MAG: hypothetical protein ACP5QG_02605 [candidate division WOR-3 bacterium]